MKKLLMTGVAFALLTTTAQATVFTVPNEVSAGHLNIRSGPGTNHSLLGAIPAGATINAGRCSARDDGIRGGDWCVVSYNGVTGWASTAGLMPVALPPEPKIEALALTCVPPLDRGDRNPVKSIRMTFEYDWTAKRMLSMTVNHELYYGQVIDRFQQYSNAITKFDGTIYGWTGTWVKNPARTMAGGAFIGQDGRWYYREKGWINGVVNLDVTALCHIYEGD